MLHVQGPKGLSFGMSLGLRSFSARQLPRVPFYQFFSPLSPFGPWQGGFNGGDMRGM